MADETLPTSEWEHSHALNDGDKLTDFHNVQTVERINDDGSVVFERGDTYSEGEITTALSDGLFKRVRDNKSHELASY